MAQELLGRKEPDMPDHTSSAPKLVDYQSRSYMSTQRGEIMTGRRDWPPVS